MIIVSAFLFSVQVLCDENNSVQIRISFNFLPGGGGGQNEIVWIIGGQVYIRVQSMGQTRRVWGHTIPGNFDFIRHNLVKSGTVFAQT